MHKMKNRIAIIRPFFQGHFLNYFQLFLNSCKANKEFDWFIFTDNEDSYDYPENVHKIMMTFDEMRDLVKKKFTMEVSLERPYKLCDYKCAYGYIFSEYIKDYDFWGHTDYDVIYGRLGKFVTDDILDKYDKIFTQGHFTLYRNTKEISEMFMDKIDGRYLYKEVMQSDQNKNFDEDWNGILNVNDIFRQNRVPIYYNENNKAMVADIYTKSSNFKVTYQNPGEWIDIIEHKKNAVFVYDNGKLLRYEYVNGHVSCSEYMYIHLQKRQMKVDDKLLNNSKQAFTIIPNAFETLECPVDDTTFKRINQKNFNVHYFKLRAKNLKIKITQRIFTRKNS